MFTLTSSGLHRYTRQHLRHDRDAAREEVRRVRGGVRQTARELGIAIFEARHANARADRLQDELNRALAANEAYAHAVSSKIGQRDTTAMEDQPTMPQGTNVRTLREAHGVQPAGPVILPVEPVTAEEPTLEIRFATPGHLVTATGDCRAKASA